MHVQIFGKCIAKLHSLQITKSSIYNVYAGFTDLHTIKLGLSRFSSFTKLLPLALQNQISFENWDKTDFRASPHALLINLSIVAPSRALCFWEIALKYDGTTAKTCDVETFGRFLNNLNIHDSMNMCGRWNQTRFSESSNCAKGWALSDTSVVFNLGFTSPEHNMAWDQWQKMWTEFTF